MLLLKYVSCHICKMRFKLLIRSVAPVTRLALSCACVCDFENHWVVNGIRGCTFVHTNRWLKATLGSFGSLPYSTWPKSKKWNLNFMQNTKAHTLTHTHTYTHRHHVDNVLSIAFCHFCFSSSSPSSRRFSQFAPQLLVKIKIKSAKRKTPKVFTVLFLWYFRD